MIARIGRAAERGVRAAVLRLLLAPALACNLAVAATQKRIACAYRDGGVGGECAADPLAGYIVVEPCRSPFARCVVEHSLVRYGSERHHAVHGQGLPRLDSILQLLGE